ncbi:hypothetical protein SAMN05421741_11365 [Paenimyroides ummariense]|uniref:Uncharacterized protein n=1 Tax=Paenimyroides ummariense TaxID=913024 RepID=A0A1I5CUC9_9FLAO|nr:hypothetical protein [Paenimyroides ummariense]SFN90558.1 hypothetical protein SAMN05421741_11365 [Paenimyroides ummariense]
MRSLDYYHDLFEFFISKEVFKILNRKEFIEMMGKIKSNHGLKSRSSDDIERYLINEFLKKIKEGDFTLYILRNTDIDIFDVSSTINRMSVFSYQSALYINGLVESLPLEIYLNKERNTPSNNISKVLKQEDVDTSFSKAPRVSVADKNFKKNKIHVINGQFQNKIGVTVFRTHYLVTDLERTLIDCVVRPFYAGGTSVIMEAFKKAKGKLDTKKLFEYLLKMHFTYPYHQAIGLYLEKSGYSTEDFKSFLELGKQIDFYLDYNIKYKKYSEKWGVFYPEALDYRL